MSYASPKIKRYAGKRKPTDKNESPKNSKAKQKRNEIVNVTTTTTAPVRIRPRSPTRTTVSVTIENRNSDVDGFSITAYLPQSGWKKLKLQATPGMTVQEVVEAELPEVGQIAYQVYQFPSRALLNPEREVTVLKNQEISIEPMQTSMSDMQEDPRLSIVKELLASEDNYLENLKSIFDTYAEPLKSWGVGPSDMKILFESVGKLCDILMNFFSELEIAVSRWCPWTTRIGGLFKQYPKFWILYEEYSTKYPDAIKLLRWKQDNDPAFVNFLQKKRGAARHTLESLMLLPVHRVWEYDRLMSQLLNYTPDSHPDYPDLHSTVVKVHMMVQSREDYLNYSENMSRIRQVESRFPNENLYLNELLEVSQAYATKGGVRKQQPGSVSPSTSRIQSKIKMSPMSSLSCIPLNSMDMSDGPSMVGKRKSARLYIQEGPVMIIQGLHQQERYMFLFDDLLLIAKPSGKHKQHKTFRLKHRVRVSEMWISECVDEVTDASISLENAFVFGWPTCNLVAAFGNTGERELWKGLFTKHIDIQQQLIEPKTLYIHISNEVELSTSMGPPETLEVDYNETVRDVLSKALEIFRISESAYSFQLWVKFSRTEDGYPLIGHEFPYAIHLSNARNEQGMDSNSHVQFVIRRRQRSVEQSSAETTPSHQSHSRRPHFRRTIKIKNLPWGKWKKQREIVKPKVKFFGGPLQHVMPDGRMSTVLQAILARMYVDGPITHGILRKSANAQKVKELKAAIDNGQQVDIESVATHVVAALFKEFLRNIPGGLLPSSRYTVLVASNDCKDIDDRAMRISREVEKFEVENRVLVKHVIPLLHHISRFNATNGMSTINIAICLAPSLLWPDTGLDVIMNEVPPLVQFLIEHSPKIFGSDLPELFENLPPPASDFDPSTTDNTPPVTLVPTKKEDGSNKKITNRIPISISSEESLHSQGDTSLSDDSLGESQIHSDSMLYEDNVPVSKKGSKHIAQGGRGSVLLSGQSIASLHQDTDEDEDDILPLPKVLLDDAQSDEDTHPTGVKTFSNHWRRVPPRRNRHKSSEESRRRSHIGLQHEPLSINTSVSPSGSQSSSSPNLSPKVGYPREDSSLRENRVQPDPVLGDDAPVRRRNKRSGNAATGRPVGIIEVQPHSPYSSASFITAGTVTERFRTVAQYPSTYSFDSIKSSSSEERPRNNYNSSVTEKDKYTTSASPKTSVRKRFEVNDRSITFDYPKRRSLRGNKEKRSRKAGRSQSMKETLRPESLIVNVHYHTTSSSYDDLTKFKRGRISDYAAPVQASEGPVDDFPESEQNLRNLHNSINKPATYQSKEINRPFPLKIQNTQQNTSPRASRLLPDNEETKLKMVSTLKQRAIAKLARSGSTQQSPTDTNANAFSGLQRKSLPSASPIERRSPPTHRFSSSFSMTSNAASNHDKIEPCRITRRYAGQPRIEPKRKSLVEGIAEEKQEANRDWKSQAPTMAEKKKVWQEFIKKPSAERHGRTESESSGTVKAELEAAHQKLQFSKQETAQEETKPKPTMLQVSKFVTTATPRVAIRQVKVKSFQVNMKTKPRKIIFCPPRRIVEVYK